MMSFRRRQPDLYIQEILEQRTARIQAEAEEHRRTRDEEAENLCVKHEESRKAIARKKQARKMGSAARVGDI